MLHLKCFINRFFSAEFSKCYISVQPLFKCCEIHSGQNYGLAVTSVSSLFLFLYWPHTNDPVLGFFLQLHQQPGKKYHTTLLFHFSSSSNPHSQGEANFTHFGSLTKYRPQMKVQVHGNTIWKFNEASDFPKVLPLYTAQINCEALFLFATAFNVRLSFQILSCTGSLVSFSA